VAFVATCSLALVAVQAVSVVARSLALEHGQSAAVAATLATLLVAVTFTGAHVALRSARALPWIGAGLSLAGAAWLAWLHVDARASAIAVLVTGTAQALAAIAIASRLPPSLSGMLRRRPVMSALWSLLALLLLIQSGRLSAYMADPSIDWWLTTRLEFWSRHMCMPAYIEAADLNRQGNANVYAAEHYAAVTRAAKPVLTVRNMEAFAGDPFQYPPQFLLLPRLALSLTDDFLTLRTIWYALQVLGFVAIAFALCAWIGGTLGMASAFLIPAVWLSVPAMQSLQYGQFHLAALVIAVGGMLAVEKRRDALGGSLLAVATLAKVFPGILLVLLVVQRRWRALGWAAGAAVAITLVAVLVIGLQPFRAFLGYQLPRMQSGEAFDFAKDYPEYRLFLVADNFSPAGLVAKLHELGVRGATPRLGRLALSGYSILLLAVAAIAGRKGGSRRERACRWMALLNLAALQSPGAFADYVTVGSVWLLALLPDQIHGHPGRTVLLACCWVFFALVPGVPPVPSSLPVPLMMILTTLGVILLVGFNAWVIVRTSQRDGRPVSA
jgi:hypothetical protein